MFTSVDKALAAILSGLAFVANSLWGWDLGLSPELYATLGALVSSLLVYLVPNKDDGSAG